MNQSSRIIWTIFTCLLANVNVLLAQPNKVNKAFEDDIYQKAMLLLDFTQNVDKQVLEDDVALEEVAKLLTYSFTDLDTLKKQLLYEEAKAIDKDFGLALSARYAYNGDVADQIIEPGSRWRVGLEWDVLEDGWFDRKRKVENIELEKELFQLEQKMNERATNYPYVYNKIIYTFNLQKIKILQTRIPYLKEWLKILKDLYYIHDVKYTDVLDVQKELDQSHTLLTAYQNFNKTFKRVVDQDTLFLDPTALPIIEIDIDKILGDTIYEQLMDKVVEIEQNKIMLRDDQNNLPRLKLFGNYNVSTNQLAYARSFGSVGAQFNMPLDFNKKEKRMMRFLEGEMIQEKADFDFYNTNREILNNYAEYNYNLKQYIEALHKVAKIEELLRIEKVLLTYDQRGHAPLSALKYQDMILLIGIEQADIQQMMYLKLAKIATRSHHADFMSCLEVRTFEEVGKKLEGNRFVILNKDDLNQDFIFLTNYLEKNEFRTVVLEADVPALFLQKLKEKGFNVLVKNDPIFTTLPLQKVPVEKFHNRNHLEFWIASARRAKPKSIFLFENINVLIQLDRKNKQLVMGR
ncbi:MAG: hypothetical protein AAF573_03345 [Bacteroidota bacterium]